MSAESTFTHRKVRINECVLEALASEGCSLAGYFSISPVFLAGVLLFPVFSAGGDTSSSSTGTASPVPNSYDSLEGGSYPGRILISALKPFPTPKVK